MQFGGGCGACGGGGARGGCGAHGGGGALGGVRGGACGGILLFLAFLAWA